MSPSPRRSAINACAPGRSVSASANSAIHRPGAPSATSVSASYRVAANALPAAGIGPASAATNARLPMRIGVPSTVAAIPAPVTCCTSGHGRQVRGARRLRPARAQADARTALRARRRCGARRPSAGVQRLPAGEPQAAFGQRAGLVEHDVRDARQRLERVGAREHHPAPRQRSGGGRERGRRGQRERARARHHQHGERDRRHAHRIDVPP